MGRFCVIGCTGLFGLEMCRAVLAAGHTLVAVSRGRASHNTAAYEALEALGVTVHTADYGDVDRMAGLLAGCDVALPLFTGVAKTIVQLEGRVLEACQRAGVGRFIPDEFGVHTQSMDFGEGVLFDIKKQFMRDVVVPSGVPYTVIYPGGIFDYFIPNLTYYRQLTTFGDVDLKFPSHSLRDICEVTVRAAMDPQCVNKCVQIDVVMVTQRALMATITSKYPQLSEHKVKHVSTDEIERVSNAGDPDLLPSDSVHGLQPELERAQINRACYVRGRLLGRADHPSTLWVSKLYPDHKFQSAEEKISERAFILGEKA